MCLTPNVPVDSSLFAESSLLDHLICNMAYHHGRRSIRETYEEHFPLDGREVTVHRVVNIVEKRNHMHPQDFEFDRGYRDDHWYDAPPNFHERDCHREGNYNVGDSNYDNNYSDSYAHDDYRYNNDSPNCGGFRRQSPPPPHQGPPYSHPHYARDDLRHQLGSRRSDGPPAPFFHKRGRGSGPSQRHFKSSRDRSPRRKSQPPPPTRSGSSTRTFSPNRDKDKPTVQTTLSSSSSTEEMPSTSASFTETPPASAPESEEAVAAGTEPKPKQEEDVKARRMEAIKSKALEIEKHFRKDCETFCTVVKMLTAKEPSLATLLQRPLDENLSEIKQHCLDALRHFVKELDEVLESPDNSATTGDEKSIQ